MAEPDDVRLGAEATRMREDWDRRAREDANYYVGFGRKQQTQDEFFSTAAPIVTALERELPRIATFTPREKQRGLEIGCGPGRLLRAMQQHFGDLYGVDISREMVARARANLAAFPRIHVSVIDDPSLRRFSDGFFDFVYSYAVFQHIPSRDVVLGYLAAIARVLKPGGAAHFQLDSRADSRAGADTWSGVRFQAAEIANESARLGMRLMNLTGVDTQYLWVTWEKPDGGDVRIRALTSGASGEPLIASGGRFGDLSLWVDNLPVQCDLSSIEVRLDGTRAEVVYIAARDGNRRQVNVFPPSGLRTGLVTVGLYVEGKLLCPAAWIHVIEAGPPVPHIERLTDGENLMANDRAESGYLRMRMQELASLAEVQVQLGEREVSILEGVCLDPRTGQWELLLQVPSDLEPGVYPLETQVNRMQLATVLVALARKASS